VSVLGETDEGEGHVTFALEILREVEQIPLLEALKTEISYDILGTAFLLFR